MYPSLTTLYVPCSHEQRGTCRGRPVRLPVGEGPASRNHGPLSTHQTSGRCPANCMDGLDETTVRPLQRGVSQHPFGGQVSCMGPAAIGTPRSFSESTEMAELLRLGQRRHCRRQSFHTFSNYRSQFKKIKMVFFALCF